MVAYRTCSNPIEIGDLGSKVSDIISFFLHNSLMISLLCFSALSCPIKMKFGMLLRYALSRLAIAFDKNRMGDDIIMTSFNFYCH